MLFKMKKLLFAAITILISFSCYSQDKIIKTNGEEVTGKIYGEDNTSVYLTIRRNNDDIKTFIKKSEISSINYFDGQSQIEKELDKASIGLGMGLDFGGFGANILAYPQKNIGIFGGLGYALAGVGFNVGAKLRLASNSVKSKISTYGLIMYGYNASISVKNATELNKLFYGPSVGIGFDTKPHPSTGNYWSIALLVPFRSSDVDNYIDDLKQNHGVEFDNELIPVAFTIGYRFKMN